MAPTPPPGAVPPSVFSGSPGELENEQESGVKQEASRGEPQIETSLTAYSCLNDRTLMKIRAVTAGNRGREIVKTKRFDFTPLGTGGGRLRGSLAGKRNKENQDLAEVSEGSNRF